MTRQEKAELSAWLAENVMGWKVQGRTTGLLWAADLNRTQMVWGSDMHAARQKLGIHEDAIGDGFVWAPLDDLNQAVMLLDKLAEDWRWQLTNARRTCGFWLQRYPSTGSGYGSATVERDHPAHAICKAVRAAVEAGKSATKGMGKSSEV